VTESWSPLARAKEVFENGTLEKIANRYNKSISQIILRWHYQLGAVSIPKSASPIRQLENLSIFDFVLDESDMKEISGLTSQGGRMWNQDPAVYEEF